MKLSLDQLKIDTYAAQLNENEVTAVKGGSPGLTNYPPLNQEELIPLSPSSPAAAATVAMLSTVAISMAGLGAYILSGTSAAVSASVGK